MAAPRLTPEPPAALERRSFLGILLAAPTLVVAARLGADAAPAGAAVPSPPEPSDELDLGDLLNLAAAPTANLISIRVHSNGTASFALPRAEVGQGLTTAVAMIIAEEMDLPLAKVKVTLADARPELLFNQLTGGSNSIRSLYTPVRRAAATARARLVHTAARQWGVDPSTVSVHDGEVRSRNGKKASVGSLARAAAVTKTTTMSVRLKPSSDFEIVGKPHRRIDALAAVTGAKVFAMDLKVPNAMPTMVCRPPSINGTVKTVHNRAAVLKMPGITDVVRISTGVAVRGKTFGQCIDAVRALKVTWGAGSEPGKDDADVLKELKAAEIPLAVPKVPVLADTVEGDFTFWFASNSPLETNCAIADVRADRAEIWSSLKSPITAQGKIADRIGLPQHKVKVHVVQGGGSFGRHLFWDAAIEAAEISKKVGKPVKLMWHRTDDFRHGRAHPACTSRVRATTLAGNVLTYEQRHTSVSTDFTHGLGEIITAYATQLPEGNFLGFSQTVFELTANVAYNFGVTTQLLNEVDMGFHTGSMRNVYSPNVCVAQELIVDELAKKMGKDPVAFRREFLKEDRWRAVLDKAASVGKWGRKMPAGTAQGIAFHAEYKGATCALVEIDCRHKTVHRKIRDAYTGPRVTKVVFVVDVGLPINPKGLEAQMIGGISDGIAHALTSSLHFKNGIPLEGSWDNYWYTRQWNVPNDVQVIVMPANSESPGGAGEFGVAATYAAVASAYGRATGKMPTSFPINHDKPLGFEPLPTVPSIPQSPTDGLKHKF
jgi:isoquinoline 1-oxidoreductase subunit beta